VGDNQGVRVAAPSDVASAVEILVGAFYDDPTWSWAFPDPDARPAQYRALWGLFVAGAMRYQSVWLAAGNAAVSVWIPPGGSELSDEQEESLEPLLVRLLGHDAPRVLRAFELIEAAHPRDAPHYYLSLLGTDPARRGHGYGLSLLAANLRRVDDAGAPAYLESSNPANVSLYERHGFQVIGSVEMPEAGPTLHTMWRAPTPSVR
jgi:GNAT superfamily N-acetyltransferase